MMITKFVLFFILFILICSFKFQKGTGAQYELTSKEGNADLSIYVGDVSDHNMAVEFYFGTGGVLASHMWQQFDFELKGSSPVKIEKGYVLFDPTEAPEVMPKKLFKLNKGLQVEDFLFVSHGQIKKDFVADELVEVPAGSIVAKHYKKHANGQVVDFWIADEVKPVGLIKLVSKSKTNASSNYTIELKTLLTNVRPVINPGKAKVMSKESKIKMGLIQE